MDQAMDLSTAIRHVMERGDLSQDQAQAVLGEMVSGGATDAQIGAFLVAMNMKGPTVDEITGFWSSLMEHASPFPAHGRHEPLLDVVGTGGDGSHSINVSTTASLVVAGTGVSVAKHGNRAASSRSGSADVLRELGANLDMSLDQAGACLDEVGFVFLFAPHCHPAMRHVGKARMELGIRSLFNLIGPLSNPAPVTHVLMGVYSSDLSVELARMLQRVGKRAAFVVHGAGGMDELSLAGPNHLVHLHNGRIDELTVDAVDLGLPRSGLDEVKGGDPADNAGYTRGILAGEVKGPMRDVVVLNAAAALATEDGDIGTHLAEAEESIDSGKALDTLERFVAFTQDQQA